MTTKATIQNQKGRLRPNSATYVKGAMMIIPRMMLKARTWAAFFFLKPAMILYIDNQKGITPAK